MGRSFASIRQRANGIAERWSLAVRALKRDDREHGRHLVALAKQHVSESFVACNNPLEAVVFSILGSAFLVIFLLKSAMHRSDLPAPAATAPLGCAAGAERANATGSCAQHTSKPAGAHFDSSAVPKRSVSHHSRPSAASRQPGMYRFA